MAVAALKIKVLPESPETDLMKMKADIEKSLIEAGALKINSIEEEPIAFGLKALIVFFAWPEQNETELAEATIRKVENVSSVEVIDYRRAFG